MKQLTDILNESILDIDFDVEDEVVYAINVKDVIIDLIKNPELQDVDAKFKEISDLLTDIASDQRADKMSIMKKMRMKDNTSIWVLKVPYPDRPYKIQIRRFIQNPRPMEVCITLYKNADGTGRAWVSGPYKCNHLSQINPGVAKSMAFMSTSVWDDIVGAISNR